MQSRAGAGRRLHAVGTNFHGRTMSLWVCVCDALPLSLNGLCFSMCEERIERR